MIPVVSNRIGHHHRRDDLDNDTYVVAHSLSSEGADASEDGTGRGTPLTVVPFDTTQLTSVANYSNPKAGEPCHPLASKGHAPAIAFSAKDHGQDASDDISPTLRSGNHKHGNANGGCGPAVCFSSKMGGNDGGIHRDGSTSTVAPNRVPAVAFTERTRKQGRNFEAQEELSYALTNPGSGGRTHSRSIGGNFGVRRLTPRECERLMGLPDDYTAGFSDSVRYRMIGNSAAVPVIEWLAKAIAKQLPAARAGSPAV